MIGILNCSTARASQISQGVGTGLGEESQRLDDPRSLSPVQGILSIDCWSGSTQRWERRLLG